MNTVPIGQDAFSQFRAAGFTPLQIYTMVTQMKSGYAMSKMALPKVMRELAKMYNGTASIKAQDRVYKFPRLGNLFPFAVSNGATLSNSNLVATVTLSDSQYMSLGEGATIYDNRTNAFGVISTITPGQMIVSYLSDSLGSGAFTSNDFAVGNQICYVGNSGGIRNYKAAAIALPKPDLVPFQIGQFSSDAFIYAEDAAQGTVFKVNGKDYYIGMTEMNALDLMQAAMTNHFFSLAGEVSGNNPKPASFLNQMKTGGSIMEAKNGYWTLEDFEDKINNWTINSGISGEVFVLCDQLYATNISRAFRDYIKTAGKDNIFGSDNGLNITRIEIGSIALNVTVEPYFNNYQMNGGNKKDSALWFSADKTTSVDGKYIPPIVDIYYGEEGLQRTVIEGKKDLAGKSVAKGSNDQPSAQATYEINIAKVLTNPDNFMFHQGRNI